MLRLTLFVLVLVAGAIAIGTGASALADNKLGPELVLTFPLGFAWGVFVTRLFFND